MTDALVTIAGTVRTTTGKGPARRSRKAGKLPASLSEAGKTTSLEIDPKLLSKAFKGNKQFNLELNGKTSVVKIQEVQVHPVSRAALHVDLVRP